VSERRTLEDLLADLSSFKADRGRQLGDVGVTAVGAAVGAAASGTAAALTGATAIPVITSVAQVIGLSITLATPVGWIAGGAILGGALCYGVSRLVLSGGRAEGKVRERKAQTLHKLQEMEARARSAAADPIQMQKLLEMLREVLANGHLTPDLAYRLLDATVAGKVDVQTAVEAVAALRTPSP
jgi:hypothetical protein